MGSTSTISTFFASFFYPPSLIYDLLLVWSDFHNITTFVLGLYFTYERKHVGFGLQNMANLTLFLEFLNIGCHSLTYTCVPMTHKFISQALAFPSSSRLSHVIVCLTDTLERFKRFHEKVLQNWCSPQILVFFWHFLYQLMVSSFIEELMPKS
jgi:hypothetical protein